MSVSPLGTPLTRAARTLWWTQVLRGVLAIVFGVVAFISPRFAAAVIVVVFGVYALVDGVTEIGNAVTARRHGLPSGWLWAQGIISAVAGVVALVWPLTFGSAIALLVLWIIAFYSLVLGLAGVPAALAARGVVRGWGWLLTSAIVSLVFGVLLVVTLIAHPGAAIGALIWLVGLYAIVFGVVLIALGLALRRVAADARSGIVEG